MNSPPRSSSSPRERDFYEECAEDYVARTIKLDMSPLYAPFLELLPAGGSILDAGCGSGRDSLAFSRRGFLVTAFDASLKMVQAAKKLTGLEVTQMRFQEMVFAGEFDGIWACASLLHVRKDEISHVFDRFIRAMKPGGYWYMSFKRGEGESVRSGRLFNNYSEGSLKRSLARHHLIGIDRIWITYDVRPDRRSNEWVNAIVHRNQ